jgi:hypothetical protein
LFIWFFNTAYAQQLYFKNASETDESKVVESYLLQEVLHLSSPFSLLLDYTTTSATAKHFTYQLCCYSIPIFAQKIKINFSHTGKIISVTNNTSADLNAKQFDNAENIYASDSFKSKWQKRSLEFKNNYLHITQRKVYFMQSSSVMAAIEFRFSKPSVDSTYIFDMQSGVMLASFNNARNFTDTTIKVKVFMPDPLTKAKQVYGGVYINNLDANASWLDDALVDTIVQAQFDATSNNFILENAFAKIVDVNPPVAFPVAQSNANFYFNRTQSEFEDCNAFFHVTNFHKRLQNLGFPNLLNLQLRIDAHGSNGSDNSTFYTTNPPLLDLGTGGVNDAEDADVIIHEYAHGLSWSANNNFISTAERLALDEGLADYFATSYSRSIDTFNWQKVFSWDGHNEFWAGRNAITVVNYSLPFSANIYVGGSVWNNAMSIIWTELGADITDKLMLQSMYFFTDSTTFTEAANYVLLADSLLYNGVHTNIICKNFAQKLIYAKPCVPESINLVPSKSIAMLANHLAFGNRLEPLHIYGLSKKSIEVELYNANGQKVYSEILKTNGENLFLLRPISNISPGTYILKIRGLQDVFKIPIL